MKIAELYIYGYGQLENLQITGLSDFQIFFGENEAGKSTIMAFIHGILFGFPTKQHAELRYEPKGGTRYGGKLKVIHPKFGGAVIERVKGKAAGDVRVVLDNGVSGGEELLKELLANFDKNLFQAIFSFNLHGLQNIHQMKGEDIGRFLFSAGTLGTERLSKAETMLQKELELRFKPSGKKPLVNEKLQELHTINLELKKAAVKNKEYESLIEKRTSLQQEMKQINDRIREAQENLEKQNEWKRIEAAVKEEAWTKEELMEMGEISFPAHGLERFEKLNQLILPYHAEIISLRERIEQLKIEMAEVKLNEGILENEPAILKVLDQVPLYEQLKLELQQCEAKMSDFSTKLSVINEKLHLSLTEEDILSINTNIYVKNQVELTARKSRRLAEVKEELEERYQEEKKRLEELEISVQSAQRLCLPEQERMLLEEQVSQDHDKKNFEMELAAVQEKQAFYLHTAKQERAASERQKFQLIIFEVIVAVFAVYGLCTSQWVLFILGAAGIIVTAIFLVKSLRQRQSAVKSTEETLKGLREKEKQIGEKLQSAVFRDIAEIQGKLKLDTERREQLQALQLRLNQQESQYENVIGKFEAWELEMADHKRKLQAVQKELKIPENIASAFLFEAFQLLEQSKAVIREQSQLRGRMQQIKAQLVEMEEGVFRFADLYLAEGGGELHNTAFLLRKQLKEEHEKLIRNREREKLLSGMEIELAQKTKEYEQLLEDRAELFSAAKVENEQQFYELGTKAAKQLILLERLGSLQSQLHYSILSLQERSSFLQTLPGEEVLTGYIQESKLLQTRLNQCQEEQAAINYEIQTLEEGGIYSDILHHYKQKKFELDGAVKEWAVYQLADDMLSTTIESYKNIRLPKMLAKAEEYLAFLTRENYHRIHLHSSGTGFLVERKDRALFEANELSQATTEQLYVSIRLALATTIYENYQFPIIIDDSFVNFDIQRAQRVIELLKSLKHQQILFFTCHAHLLPFFKSEQVLHLEKGAVQDYFVEL